MLLKEEGLLGRKGTLPMEDVFGKLEELSGYKEILEITYLYFINNSDLEEGSHLMNLLVFIKLQGEHSLLFVIPNKIFSVRSLPIVWN